MKQTGGCQRKIENMKPLILSSECMMAMVVLELEPKPSGTLGFLGVVSEFSLRYASWQKPSSIANS